MVDGDLKGQTDNLKDGWMSNAKDADVSSGRFKYTCGETEGCPEIILDGLCFGVEYSSQYSVPCVCKWEDAGVEQTD